MKLILIKPNIGRREHSLYVDHGRMEPLMLAVIASYTPPDVEVVLYDDRMEPIPFDDAKPTDLVAITVETYTARRAYEIADAYRARGVPVILGGIHVNFLPEEARPHADSLFLGDAETLWPQVVEDAKAQRLRPEYKAEPGIGQIGGVLPRRDIFKGKGYLPMSLMQFSRGCRFACHFCAVSSYFDKKFYLRKIDEVLKEIEAQDRKFLFFIDDNIASDRYALKEFCHALTPMKVQWISQMSLDVTHDPELMKLLERSGHWGSVMGFESITLKSLRESKKSPNIPGFSDYRREVQALKDHGMLTWAAFTLGYDNDTEESIHRTMEFALENKFAFAAFNILMPYPATPLYRKLEEEGRLLYGGKWWLHPDYRFNQAAYVPANMSPQELTDACHRARGQYNALPGLLRRMSDWQSTARSAFRMASFIRYAWLFRQEVYRKHGMRFGLH